MEKIKLLKDTMLYGLTTFDKNKTHFANTILTGKLGPFYFEGSNTYVQFEYDRFYCMFDLNDIKIIKTNLPQKGKLRDKRTSKSCSI